MADHTVPLPDLPMEALQGIEQAEKDAQERYKRHRWPHFPAHPDFSFHAASIFRSMESVIGYLRVLAEELMDAHLTEYLEHAPADIFGNTTLLTMVRGRAASIVGDTWTGYKVTLHFEPSSRHRQFKTAVALGTLTEHPELEPSRYPEVEEWAQFMNDMQNDPDSRMSQLNALYESTIRDVLGRKTAYYLGEAISRIAGLHEKIQEQSPSEAQPAASSGPEPRVLTVEKDSPKARRKPGPRRDRQKAQKSVENR
jgi:hypothetical protein